MTFSQSLLSLWPGLARLWVRGELSSLAQAVAFGLILQFALVVTFIWPEVLGSQVSPWFVGLMAWVLVVWFWVAGMREGNSFLSVETRNRVLPDEISTTLLVQAQTEYLKGHWIEAETVLLKLLSQKPADAEGRLLLAGVLRRTKRLDQAEKQLKKLTDQPTAPRWHYEIAREREILNALREENQPAEESVQIPVHSPQQRRAA